MIKQVQNLIDIVWALGRKSADPRYPSERRVPYTGRTQAGVFITADRALMNDTVWAAHRYLTQTVAQLPAKIIKKEGKIDKIITDHPVDRLLNYRPNPELSPFQFRETMVGWALMFGNGIAEIERNGFNSPIALWPVHPDRIEFLRDVESGELIYRINNGVDGATDLKSQDVFHLRGFGNGAVGLSVIEYAAQSIGWARATELFGASFFGEGMHFGGTYISKTKLDADAMENLREELNQTYRGPGRSGKWFIGDGDATVTKTTATPDEAQFVTTLQHQVESICRWMGVPPQKVHHLIRMTFNNVEQMSIDVVGDSIVPWAMRMEQECSYKLFGQNRQNLSVRFEVKGLLRGSYTDRQEGLQIQRRNGIISSNDWAEIEDIPLPKHGGDLYIIEKNMVTTEQMEKGLNLQTKTSAPNPNKNDNSATAQNDNNNKAALMILETVIPDLEMID